MGRSCSFDYTKIPKRAEESYLDSKTLNKIRKLKKGDLFRFVIKDYLIYDESLKKYLKPITRTPSIYGYEPTPLCSALEYIVEDDNEEPELERITGLRSLRFHLKESKERYFPTHRLMTDGTVRECEGLGIDFIVHDFQII